jgi:hypothetical protein
VFTGVSARVWMIRIVFPAGSNDDANLDEGTMWPTSWALTKLTAADRRGSARW